MSKIYAVKGNREERIQADEKDEYLKAGYDIIEDGKREHAPSSTVAYADYKKILEENTLLKKQIKKLKKEDKENEKQGE